MKDWKSIVKSQKNDSYTNDSDTIEAIVNATDSLEESKPEIEIKEEKKEDDPFPRLTPEQYYRFRFLLASTNLAKEKVESKRLKGILNQKNIMIAQLQHQLFGLQEFRQVENEAKIRQHEYSAYLAELETLLGFSFDNKTVDDETFEIKDAPEAKT